MPVVLASEWSAIFLYICWIPVIMLPATFKEGWNIKKHTCKDFASLEISDIKNPGLKHNKTWLYL